MATPTDSREGRGDECPRLQSLVGSLIRCGANRPILMLAAVLIPLPLIAQLPNRTNQSRSAPQSQWRQADRSDSEDATTEPVPSANPRRGLRSNGAQDAAGERRHPPAAEFDEVDRDTADSHSSPNGFAHSGQVWREYNLAPYTNRLPNMAHPEEAVVDWILRQTGAETWHGEEIAVLSATRGRLRVFHYNDIQEQVAQIVERFTHPVQSQATLTVQIATTTDLNWRRGLVHLLKPAAFGNDGQQTWLLAPEDASLLRYRIQTDRSFTPVSQQVTASNGQEAGIDSSRAVSYVSGLELSGGTYSAYQPVIGRLQDGVRVSFVPLWTSDGAAVDVLVRVTTRVVQRLHHAQGASPLSSGTQETFMQIPEVVASQFEQTLRWPMSQVLLISAGVQPPNPSSRRGAFGLAPAPTELLILAEILAPPARSVSRRTTDR